MEGKENDALRARIAAAASRGALSHAVILSGEGDRQSLARYTAAAMQCRSSGSKPCLCCNACRKVLQDIHPDVVWVQDTEHRILPVDTVRSVRKDVYIRPNEGLRKVYIFPDSTQLDPRDQDVLLKTVEEGPAYASFLFCTENSAALLPTIRSRCVEYRLRPEQEEGQLDAFLPFCRLLARRDVGALAVFLLGMEREKKSREELAAFLDGSREVIAELLLLLSAVPGHRLSRQELLPLTEGSLQKKDWMEIARILQQFHIQCSYNVGVGQLLGALLAQLDQALA